MNIENDGARLPAVALEALFARGKSLRGVKATEEEGQALILEAAHQGHGDAAHMMALLLAADSKLEDAWGFALAYLGRAAKAGHLLAQRTLAFLAHDKHAEAALARGEKLEDQTWRRLHDAIDPAHWLATPAPKVVSSTPYIATVEGLLPPGLCDWIMERARPRLKRAQVYDRQDSGGRNSGQRTNSETGFDFDERDLAMMFVSRRIMKLTGVGFAALEPFSVLHYTAGQQFKPHYDFLDLKVPAYAAEVAARGQRVITVLVYLNDEYAGGESDFPRLDYRFKGRKGDALLFHNMDAQGAPDFRTLHAGLPPGSGEKWLFSQWIRGRPAAA